MHRSRIESYRVWKSLNQLACTPKYEFLLRENAPTSCAPVAQGARCWHRAQDLCVASKISLCSVKIKQMIDVTFNINGCTLFFVYQVNSLNHPHKNDALKTGGSYYYMPFTESAFFERLVK